MSIPFPVFFPLTGEKVLIVGTGEEAVAKLRLLARTEAMLTIIGPAPDEAMRTAAQETGANLVTRAFHPDDLAGMRLCFVALEEEPATVVVMAARAAGVPVNAVDRPALCDFIVPAIIDRAPVLVAISTGGAAPALARDLRRRVESVIPAAYGRLATICRRWRERVASSLPDAATRRRLWDEVLADADRLMAASDAEAEASIGEKLSAAVEQENAPTGRILFVGAGPGEPELLTLKGLQAIQRAETILYDARIDTRLLDLARRGARLVKLAADQTPETFAAFAADRVGQGELVARLTPGSPDAADPEIRALAARAIDVERIPGVAC